MLENKKKNLSLLSPRKMKKDKICDMVSFQFYHFYQKMSWWKIFLSETSKTAKVNVQFTILKGRKIFKFKILVCAAVIGTKFEGIVPVPAFLDIDS